MNDAIETTQARESNQQLIETLCTGRPCLGRLICTFSDCRFLDLRSLHNQPTTWKTNGITRRKSRYILVLGFAPLPIGCVVEFYRSLRSAASSASVSQIARLPSGDTKRNQT